MYREILVPTDGSAGASTAFEHALELATEFGATIHVVNAVDPTVVPVEMGDGVLEALQETGEELLEEIRERGEDAGVAVETAVLTGSPAETITRYVDDRDIDLVVMGTHGRTGLNRWLLGSVTERVVRTSPVPVLTVRDPGDRD